MDMLPKTEKRSISMKSDIWQAVEGQSPENISGYIAEATRARLESEGALPGTPAFDVRAEAASAAEIAGPDKVLKALRVLKSEASANAA